MKLTEREKILVLVFPAFLIFAGYIWIFGSSSQRELTNIRGQLAKTQAEAATPRQVWQQQTRLKQLSREIEKARTAKDDLQTQADELCGRMTVSRRDMGAIDALTALFERYNLRLMDEVPVDGGEAGGMAISLEEATRRLQEALDEPQAGSQPKRRSATYVTTAVTRRASGTKSEPNLRRLRFYGRFLDVLRALNELAEDENQAIPVSIAMEEIGLAGMYSEFRTWTLLVRI